MSHFGVRDIDRIMAIALTPGETDARHGRPAVEDTPDNRWAVWCAVREAFETGYQQARESTRRDIQRRLGF